MSRKFLKSTEEAHLTVQYNTQFFLMQLHKNETVQYSTYKNLIKEKNYVDVNKGK